MYMYLQVLFFYVIFYFLYVTQGFTLLESTNFVLLIYCLKWMLDRPALMIRRDARSEAEHARRTNKPEQVRAEAP